MLAEHRPKGLEEHLDVNPQATVAHVKQLEGLTLAVLVLRVVARHGLPPAGNTRRHRQKFHDRVIVGHELVGFDGAWADNAHLALEHVPELGNLVKRRPAQKLANLGDTRIIVNLVLGLPLLDLLGCEMLLDLIRPHHHRAQLVDVDGRTIAPDTALLVDGLTWLVEPNEPAHEERGNRASHRSACGEHDVEAALHHVIAIGVVNTGDRLLLLGIQDDARATRGLVEHLLGLIARDIDDVVETRLALLVALPGSDLSGGGHSHRRARKEHGGGLQGLAQPRLLRTSSHEPSPRYQQPVNRITEACSMVRQIVTCTPNARVLPFASNNPAIPHGTRSTWVCRQSSSLARHLAPL